MERKRKVCVGVGVGERGWEVENEVGRLAGGEGGGR